ncbi:MAG: hypothetical protein AVDCRST_MAG77-2814 [uncultured Chloroflexi bacterium]|uniref:Uncharacterized protein n=1 Tax=uncultured Chloroflexota bacterium TaxID=166587 RepID=A0A6J4J327_9CHLR|nr:MAG: hypothetical protein AVDCRST_MAG77-2814 [uncultured Chloroflexota bacterium]
MATATSRKRTTHTCAVRDRHFRKASGPKSLAVIQRGSWARCSWSQCQPSAS